MAYLWMPTRAIINGLQSRDATLCVCLNDCHSQRRKVLRLYKSKKPPEYSGGFLLLMGCGLLSVLYIIIQIVRIAFYSRLGVFNNFPACISYVVCF